MKAVRIRVEVAATVDDANRGVDLHALGDQPRAERKRRAAHHPAHAGDHRSQAQRLLDHRIQVARLQRAGAVEHAIVVQQQIEPPRKAGGGRLVPRQKQRHQLVANLSIRQRRAMLVASSKQCRERVGARTRILTTLGLASSSGDLGVDQLVKRRARLLELLAGAPEPQARRHEQRQQAMGARNRIDHRAHTPVKLALALVADTEHRAGDHPQRERLHAGRQRERPTQRPGVDLGVGRLADRLLVGGQARAVKGREHDPPVAQMLGAVEHQHRALAEDRSQQRVGLAGVELLVRTPEELCEQLGVKDHHKALVKQRAQCHRAAVASAAVLQEVPLVEQKGERLHCAWQRWTGGESLLAVG